MFGLVRRRKLDGARKMRITSFQSVYEAVLQRHGLDPLGDAITHGTARAVCKRIETRVSNMWRGWQWPELTLTEERAYRQVWNSSVQYRVQGEDGRPDELYYLPTSTYYKVRVDAPSNPPPATAPVDSTYFQVLDAVTPFVARDQRNKRSMGPVLGVYGADPSVNGCCTQNCLQFRPSEKGVTVCHGPASTVFIQYLIPEPVYTMVPYIAGKAYVRGNRVFWTEDGNCYTCIADNNNQTPATRSFWALEPLPTTFAQYAEAGAFADTLSESYPGGNTDIQARMVLQQLASAEADQALQQEVDSLTAQGYKLQWNFCRPIHGWCNSKSWTGSIAYPLTDAVERGGIIPMEPPDTLINMIYLPEIVSLIPPPEPSLQSYPSAPLPLDTLIVIAITVSGSPQQQTWRVDPGPADPLDPGHIAPSDYNATTNNKHYRKVI